MPALHHNLLRMAAMLSWNHGSCRSQLVTFLTAMAPDSQSTAV